METHLTPELIVSSLRLLVEAYKLGRERFKNKKAPEDIEKIVIKAEKAGSKPLDAAELDRNLKETLTAEDAAIVKSDLEFLSLLVLPAPNLDAFDYWGMLTRLVEGLHAFATSNRLFELRGFYESHVGQLLMLPKAGREILPEEQALKLPIPYTRESIRGAKGIAALRQAASGFPLIAGVYAQFNEYDVIGGPPSVKTDMCFYNLAPGPHPHWLRFDLGQSSAPHFRKASQYMLKASDFTAIVKALHDDIHAYAMDIRVDEQNIAPLSAAIDAFVKGNTKPTSQ